MKLEATAQARSAWYPVRAVLFVCGLGLLSREVRAETTDALEVRWSAPSPCPDENAFRQQILALASGTRERRHELRVHGAVEWQDGNFILELVVRDGELVARRRFVSGSCEDVTGAAAVSVALLMNSPKSGTSPDDDGHAAAPNPPIADEANTTDDRDATNDAKADTTNDVARPAATTANTPKANDSRTSRSDWSALVAAPSASIGFGFLSPPSVGLGAGLGLESARWRLLLDGARQFTLRVAGASNGVADVVRVNARLTVCHWLSPAPMQLAPCGTIALHYVVATGAGPGVSPRDPDFAWAAFGIGALARLRLTDTLGLRASLGLEVQSARPKIAIDGLGLLEQSGALELTALAGTDWLF